jgi:PAS domain S-box-containing protein
MNLITINQVNCKDCYKCIRYCPVKAIRVRDGHAEVDGDRCLGDGNCLRICPQHAKQVRSDLPAVHALLASGRPVIASVAPAALGIFGEALPHVIGALRTLGFTRVEETTRTAEAVARASAVHDPGAGPVITTACPAIVELVCTYYPQHAHLLAPVPSPMTAHARLLREEHGDEVAVVFIGPCIAKKGDLAANGIDAALTFDELRGWLRQAGIVPEAAAPAGFDNPPVGASQLYPLPQGLAHAAGMATDLLAAEVLALHGLPEVMAVLDDLDALRGVRLLETLACPGGCLQGPGATEGPSPRQRRADLLRLAQRDGDGSAPADLVAAYPALPLHLPTPSAEELAAILRRTGKTRPEDEHNCGACGYDTCREKAIAVFQGMAEAEMCIPYMHSRAESFANVVIRSTPNGIVVVDGALRILDVNPAFEKLFGRPLTELIGRHIRTVVEATGFEYVRRKGKPFARAEIADGRGTVRESIFPVSDEEIIIGIYIDVTEEVARRQQLQTVKQETLGKARQVIDKQMRVAQEIAGLLGETTAETKVLLTRLIALYDEEEE